MLLYNQYYRRIYEAKLHAVYYEPCASIVVVPNAWWPKCPGYYRKNRRLCGAFFALQIARGHIDDANSMLGQLYVDSSSFELATPQSSPVIPPPEGVSTICRDMVDNIPTRGRLRTCEHTMLVLRSFKQRVYTARLLESDSDLDTERLISAFEEMSWDDLIVTLRFAPVQSWATLHHHPKVLAHIGAIARRQCSRVTRLDLELVAWMSASREKFDCLLEQTLDGDLGGAKSLSEALILWATSEDDRRAREAASVVFTAAWKAVASRYTLRDLHRYFEKLPAMEEIACATNYDIRRKFYRDHLNHNVRSALLAGRLAEGLEERPKGRINRHIAAFIAGLFHDLAFPVTTFPETVRALATALGDIELCGPAFTPQSVLDRIALRLSLGTVATIASLPNILDEFRDEPLSLGDDLAQTLMPANKELLFEELACASSEGHAQVGAAVLLSLAVLGRVDGSKVSDSGIRTLMSDMTGRSASASGRELLAIIQSIALHDRKPASVYHGVTRVGRHAPTPLDWGSFGLPVVVSVADDLQEWGRPIGSLTEMVATDASITAQPGQVTATFTLSREPSTYSKVPFSLLEFAYSKLRGIGAIKYEEGHTSVELTLLGLEAFQLSYFGPKGSKICYSENFLAVDMASFPEPCGVPLTAEVAAGENQHLLAISLLGQEGRVPLDFVLISGDAESCGALLEGLGGQPRLSSIELSGSHFRLRLESGIVVSTQDVTAYRFGRLNVPGCLPRDKLNTEDNVALVTAQLDPAPSKREPRSKYITEAAHMNPKPHYLDLDWRFTERTSRAILRFAKHHRGDGPICYLGCPTVALLHSRLDGRDDAWFLLDRGHRALEEWNQKELIPRGSFREYDAFDTLPSEHVHRYAVVILDLPWYDEYYEHFCIRATELARTDGIVGLSDYPGYDQPKLERFAKIRARVFGEQAWFASIEIDYEVPEFESSWGGHRKFEHLALGVYRPTHMDFYKVDRRVQQKRLTRKPSTPDLPGYEPLEGGHYLRCISKGTAAQYLPGNVSIGRRRSVKRPRPAPRGLLAWSTRNAQVFASDEKRAYCEARTMSDVAAAVVRWEAEQGG